MNITSAIINAAAVWFVLKAVEVLPFAIYDLFVFIRENCAQARDEKEAKSNLKQRFDERRGKFEFIFSGAGFFQLPLWKRRKRLCFISSLVPLLIFILEIVSIFLGDEKRVCRTSTDLNMIKAPALRLFGEGEREVDVIGLNNEVITDALFLRPCLRRQSTFSGVEYVATACSNLLNANVPILIKKTLFPENERIFIVVLKSVQSEPFFLLSVFTRPFKDSYDNSTLIGAFDISFDVTVNGKRTLSNDAVKNFVINETITKQILDDVRVLEEFGALTPSEFNETDELFIFEWADVDDFFLGARSVIFAIMSQSRTVGLKTAAEMSELNVRRTLTEVDIMCQEDFSLPRTASIIIIATGIVLRLVLAALPKSLSSVEYVLKLLGEQEEAGSFSESIEIVPRRDV